MQIFKKKYNFNKIGEGHKPSQYPSQVARGPSSVKFQRPKPIILAKLGHSFNIYHPWGWKGWSKVLCVKLSPLNLSSYITLHI